MKNWKVLWNIGVLDYSHGIETIDADMKIESWIIPID